MPRYDFRTPRLYIDAPLDAGASLTLDPAQANYLGNVLRLKTGDSVLIFNGRDGEWRGALARSCSLYRFEPYCGSTNKVMAGNGGFHDTSNDLCNRGRCSDCGCGRYVAVSLSFDRTIGWNCCNATAARTTHNGRCI